MFKLVISVVAVIVLGIGGFFLYQSFQTEPAIQPTYESTPTAQVSKTPASTNMPATTDPCDVLTKGSADVPSLYKEGITWQQPKITEYEVPLGEEGSRSITGCISKSTGVNADISVRILDYYGINLTKHNWTNLVSASGPNGSTDSYKKDHRYIVVREIFPRGEVGVTLELFYTQ